MQFYSVCLIFLLYKTSEAIYSFRCPVQAHWKQRSEASCGSWDRYFCVYDQNKKNFTEFCKQNPDFEAPGRKITMSGSIQGVDCDNDFYQPNKFWSSGNSRCAFKKSICSDEGQLIFNNGTTKEDRLCRCDYTRGYDFLVRPKHECYCIPSEEDCSCYNKKCSVKDILSPDYECIDSKTWEPNSNCDSIDIQGLPGHIEAPSTVIPWFETYVPVKYDTENYRQKAWIAILLLVLLPMIIILIVWILTSKYFPFKLKLHLTGLPNTPIEDRITNLENTQVQMPTLVQGLPNTQIEDRITNLENTQVQLPTRVQDFQTETLQDWTSKLAKFVITKATQYIYKCIQENNLILIVGPTGSGKSANAYHVAFRLKEESGYTVIPTRQSTDITHYHIPDTKQVFVVDDFIGKYAVGEMDAGLWEQNWSLLNMILSDNINTKLILTLRTYVWQSERYKYLSMSAFTCDLLSDKISLSLTERWCICKSYLNQTDMETLKDDIILMYSFLPSLCSSYMSYESSNNISVEQFFTVPSQIIEDEIHNFKIKSQVSFVALAILAIKQTISKNSFSIDSHEYDELVKDVFDESAFLQYPSKSLLMSSLVAFTGSYVKETIDSFMLTNEKLQSIVLRSISKLLIRSVIKHCQTEVVLNQIRLDCFIEEHSVLTIEASNENEDTYFRRLADEVGGESNTAIFENEQNKFPEFRLKFVKYMKKYVSRNYLTEKKESIPVLHVVSALGYYDYTVFFIQDTQMVNKKDSNGNIPLHVACMKGHMKIVKLLVENKSFIDIANKEGLKPFYYACENGYTQVAKYLLHHSSSSINVNEKYKKRNNGSVLHIASAKGFMELVNLLLKFKADANIQDAKGCTPLHLASNITVVRALLNSKANINAVDFFGESPLYHACSEYGENQEGILQLLIKNNASVNQKTITGFTPLHSACQSGRICVVKMLLKNGANINSSKPDTVPLHEACKVGNVNVIKILIASNASVNHPSKDGSLPLHEACSNCHIDAVKLLLDSKANVNAANEIGWTALFHSCFHGFCEIVMLLLSRGANPNIIDKNKVSPLIVACKENHAEVVGTLLRANANVNHCDKDNCSSLVVACKTGNVDLVSVLLRYSADIKLADQDMITPLHAACMNNNNTKLVLKLLERNAHVNVADKTGQTPLFKSISNGYTDIVEILLRHGASVNIRDKSGNSPLAIAEIKGHTTIVDVLRQFKHDNRID